MAGDVSLADKFAKLEELIRKEHVEQEDVYSDMGGQDTFRYCAGCGVDLDEEDCPYLAILDGPSAILET